MLFRAYHKDYGGKGISGTVGFCVGQAERGEAEGEYVADGAVFCCGAFSEPGELH